MTQASVSVIQRYIITQIKRHPMYGKQFCVIAIPNGGTRNFKEAAKLKREGVQAGVPDLCILAKNGAVFWIELKTSAGRLQATQKAFHQFLSDIDHEVVTIKAHDPMDGFRQFGNQLEMWGVI